MAKAPIVNKFGEVAFGGAVPVNVPDYTRDLLAGMRQQQASEDRAIAAASHDKRSRQAKVDKYKNETRKWVLSKSQGIWQGRDPEVKALAEDYFQTMMKNRRANPEGYDPDNDRELFGKMHDFQRATDEWRQEKVAMDKHMAIALDPGKRDTYNINEDALDAWGRGDVQGFQRALSKNIYGDEAKALDINTYSGVGFLNPIDTSDWHAETIKAGQSINVPVQTIDLGGGKFRKAQQLTPEQKEKEYETWILGAGSDRRRSLIAQAQANNPFFPEEKADEILKPLFMRSITDEEDLKGGGGGRRTPGERIEENLFSTPYKSTDKQGRTNKGINVGFKGSNKGLKANLTSGDDILTDVDLKTIYTTPDGQMEAIVMQYVQEERPMTESEKKKEEQSATASLREPIFTKSVKIEKPRVVDFNKGSNNYNTITAQYPGVLSFIEQMSETKAPAKEKKRKSTTRAAIKALVGKPGYEGYTEQELIDYYKEQDYDIK